MADEGRKVREQGIEYLQAESSVAAYEVVQLPTGNAGVRDSSLALASSAFGEFSSRGQYTLPKTSGFVGLKGNRAFWDYSANSVYYKKVNDRDYYLGRFAQDAASNSTACVVNLNDDPRYDINCALDPTTTAITGTQALNAMGLYQRGGAQKFILSSTSEAQKVDILSFDGFSKSANAIIEFAFNVVSDGSGTVVDVSVGAANATHATDADSITDSLFMHLDANNVNVNFESDDGTTEVTATDSTSDYTEGNRHEVWMDMRDSADVQIYFDGSLVLGSTVFNIDASVATWKLLAHIEKTPSTDTYEFDLHWLRAHFAEQ
jgi:hypothetical protein